MKPSVPPTSFVTSISTLRLLISSRIVLPTTMATARPKQHRREVHEPARQREHGAQPRDPRRIDLDELDFRQCRDRIGERFDVAGDAARGMNHERVRQRVAVERVERLAESRLRRGTPRAPRRDR